MSYIREHNNKYMIYSLFGEKRATIIYYFGWKIFVFVFACGMNIKIVYQYGNILLCSGPLVCKVHKDTVEGQDISGEICK